MHHPALKHGQNVLCVLNVEQQIVGLSPIFPAPIPEGRTSNEPHHIWMIMLVEPDFQEANAVRDLLWPQVLQRALAIKQTFSPGPVRLAADYMRTQHAEIAYLLRQGFEPYESLYVMQCNAAGPLAEYACPDGVTVCCRKMTIDAEQQAYLQAFNQSSPEHPKTLQKLRTLLHSTVWAKSGMAITAIDAQQQIAGSLLVYRPARRAYGKLEDVFVLPAWRRRGLARYLLQTGLTYAQTLGVQEVRLDVIRSNVSALALYQAMGYTVLTEEVLLGQII